MMVNLLVRAFFILLISCGGILWAQAHPDHDNIKIQMLLHKWANGMQMGHIEEIDDSLADDFQMRSGQSRTQFLSSLDTWQGRGFSFKHSIYNITDNDFSVTPIIVSDGTKNFSFSVSGKKTSQAWKITSWKITRRLAPDLARKLIQGPLPEQFTSRPVNIALYDEDSSEPVFARIHIEDEKGEYWPPQGHQKYIATGFRQAVGGDVRLGTRTYAYVKPDFIVDLPMGKYRIYGAKGMEYIPATSYFTVEEGDDNNVRLPLKRWINMQDKGWYAGDTHTHFINDYNGMLEAQAEDLNIVNILATKWGQVITDVTNITGQPSPLSRSENIVFYNEETRHNFIGHTILHPIKTPIYPLTWGGPNAGVVDGYDYPAMAYQADKAHAQGGIVTWAHVELPMKGELAIDVALGKIDSLDIFTWQDAFSLSNTDWYGKQTLGAVQWWYKFLNTGARLPISAGTDKMHNTQVTGSVRTYAYLGDEKLTYRNWASAIKQGRTFVTTGPMLSFQANDQPIGSVLKLNTGDELRLVAEVNAPYDRFTWDRFEIIQNGKVIASGSNPDKKDHAKLDISVKLTGSAWFAVRIYDTKGRALAESGINGVPPMAHTSPIYVDIAGEKIWNRADAAFLAAHCEKAIQWAKTTARYHNEAQRQEIITLYKQGKAVYE